MARSLEEVTFTRDCRVILIPDGYDVPVAEGARGWVTQVLGGHYTVQLETGRLVRVAASDADAIGRRAEEGPGDDGDDDSAIVDLEQVWEQLRTCYDPEIPLNIVELGLVYDVVLNKREGGGYEVHIDMTLTAPGCGMGQVLADDVQYKINAIPGVKETQVELVFDPPWTEDRMSEAGRLELGFF